MIQNILIEHNQRYPHMVIQDFVKLIYQNEFGGGHLISDHKNHWNIFWMNVQ